MTKDIFQRRIKAYEALHENKPDQYPLSFSEHLEDMQKLFEKDKFQQLSEEKKVAVTIVKLKDGRAEMKYYNAFKANDMRLLHAALFETMQIRQMTNILNPGTDHSFFSYQILPEMLAACAFERVSSLIPWEDGLSMYHVPGSVVINLIMAEWYHDLEFRDKALFQANAKLAQKLTGFERSYIIAVKHILEERKDLLKDDLETMCAAWKNVKDFTVNPFTRLFCIPAHAVYLLAIRHYQSDLEMPKSDTFCQDLVLFQKEIAYQPGPVLHEYPDTMPFCKHILHAAPPIMHLKQHGKQIILDTDLFQSEVIRMLMQNA